MENLSDFLQMIESEDQKETVPIFLQKRKIYAENGMLYGEIVIQYQYDTNMIVQYVSREGIDPIKFPSSQYLGMLQSYGQIELAKKISEDLKTKTDVQDAQLGKEFQKAIDLLKQKCFEIIIPALWIE